MKAIDDALGVRGRVLVAFKMAERETDEMSRRRFLPFVVIGAGPTGLLAHAAVLAAIELGLPLSCQGKRGRRDVLPT